MHENRSSFVINYKALTVHAEEKRDPIGWLKTEKRHNGLVWARNASSGLAQTFFASFFHWLSKNLATGTRG